MARLDTIIDEFGDDVVKDGDALLDDTSRINQDLLIECEKGENKMEPDSGVGIASWLLDEADGLDLKKEIQSEFEADGLTVLKLVVGQNIVTQATYGN